MTHIWQGLRSGAWLTPARARGYSMILLGICVGAFVAQHGPLHGDLVHVFVLGGLVVLAGWIARPSWLRAAG